VVEVVSLSAISIPKAVFEVGNIGKPLCQIFLSCSGGSLSNVPLTLVLCKAENPFTHHMTVYYWHGKNIPQGTNTLTLYIPWTDLQRYIGGKYYLFGSSQEPVNLWSDGFLRNSGNLPNFEYE